MRTHLSDAGLELFEQLTAVTFYCVDTEYTEPVTDTLGNRIISIAVVPVVSGRRVPAVQELYREMNPGVPISTGSQKVHGFSDADVKGKKDFGFYAPTLLSFLSDPAGVFVAHTSADIHALRGELERLDERKAAGDLSVTVGLADLPDLRIIDTSSLARLVKYPNAGSRAVMSLKALCELTGVIYRDAHEARGDARMTADCLLELLAYTAQQSGYWNLDALIADNNAGTMRAPRGPAHIRSSRPTDPVLPPEHLLKHANPLTDPAGKMEVKAWVALAGECSRLRCQWLRDEARVTARVNAHLLIDPVMLLLPTLTEPGQAGTLLGAVWELISLPEPGAIPGLAYTRAMQWWGVSRPKVAVSPGCGVTSTDACPSCRAGEPCPREVLHQQVARMAVIGREGTLTQQHVKRLFTAGSPPTLVKWAQTHVEVAGYAVWMVLQRDEDEGRDDAYSRHLSFGIEHKLHLVEPRLALTAAQFTAATEGAEQAVAFAQQVLSGRNTDDAYDELEGWVEWMRQTLTPPGPLMVKEPSKFPRLSRPQGRVPVNPYKVGT